MIGTMQEIIEAPEAPLEEDESGSTGTRRFTVIARSQSQAKLRLRTIKGVFIGAPFFSPYGETIDTNSVCRSIRALSGRPAAPYGGYGMYEIQASYGRRNLDEAVPYGHPVYRKDISIEQVQADLDGDGDPVVNSADEPFDPPLTKPKPNELWQVDWWIMDVTLAEFATTVRPYDGAYNLLEWQGAATGCVLCHGIRNVDEVLLSEVGGVRKYGFRASGVFEFQEEIDVADLAVEVVDKDGVSQAGQMLPGFTQLPVDRGFRKLAGVDGNGDPVFEPIPGKGTSGLASAVFLDGAGAVLPDGDTTVAIAYLMNGKYADFNALGI